MYGLWYTWEALLVVLVVISRTSGDFKIFSRRHPSTKKNLRMPSRRVVEAEVASCL